MSIRDLQYLFLSLYVLNNFYNHFQTIKILTHNLQKFKKDYLLLKRYRHTVTSDCNFIRLKLSYAFK